MSTASLDPASETVLGSSLQVGYEKRLMVAAGRASAMGYLQVALAPSSNPG